jgi:hypothetical protein
MPRKICCDLARPVLGGSFVLMSKSQFKPSEPFVRIHSALADLLRTAPQSAGVVAEILELLGQMERHSQRERQTQKPAASGKVRARRGRAVDGYEIEDSPRGPMLIERRYHTPKDFRCPWDVYNAAAHAMQGQTEPLGFDQIHAATGKQMVYMPADYLCRLCLRFWISRRLVIRSRAKYQPASPRRFVHQAQQAWKTLADQSRK